MWNWWRMCDKYFGTYCGTMIRRYAGSHKNGQNLWCWNWIRIKHRIIFNETELNKIYRSFCDVLQFAPEYNLPHANIQRKLKAFFQKKNPASVAHQQPIVHYGRSYRLFIPNDQKRISNTLCCSDGIFSRCSESNISRQAQHWKKKHRQWDASS